jgi:hypothetical protein
MSRSIIALLIALYAIAFAFGAMAAIRLPSLMMMAAFVLEDDAMAGLSGIDWRELGIAYGAPYFLAALCLYASALSLGKKKRSAMIWYLMGCVAGFPCVFLVDFESGWWRDPSVGEGAVAGAAAAAILLGIAVWQLIQKPKQSVLEQAPQAPAVQAPIIVNPAVEAQPVKPSRRKPVPAAIARQRAAWAAEGRKMLARQRRY